MLKFISKILLNVAICTLTLHAYTFSAVAHDRSHIIHKKKCAEWKVKISKTYGKQWAFAQNPEGTHCGINYNNRYVKDAEFKSVKTCNKKSKKNDCKLISSSR